MHLTDQPGSEFAAFGATTAIVSGVVNTVAATTTPSAGDTFAMNLDNGSSFFGDLGAGSTFQCDDFVDLGCSGRVRRRIPDARQNADIQQLAHRTFKAVPLHNVTAS